MVGWKTVDCWLAHAIGLLFANFIEQIHIRSSSLHQSSTGVEHNMKLNRPIGIKRKAIKVRRPPSRTFIVDLPSRTIILLSILY